MIYITGDTHGERRRLSRWRLRRLRKQDVLIICGDFGFMWDGGRRETAYLKRLGRRRYRICFIDGVHENFELLSAYPLADYCGGKARVIHKRLAFLQKGEVYDFGGETVFAYGGGANHPDSIALSRQNGQTGEPTEDDLLTAKANLAAQGNSVDYVVSYEPPRRIAEFLQEKPAVFGAHLDKIAENLTFKRWFFGCLHRNKIVTSKYTAVYDRIIPADESKVKIKPRKVK
jgi:hypothetical protein